MRTYDGPVQEPLCVIDLRPVSTHVEGLSEQVEGLGLYFDDELAHDVWVGGSLETIMKPLGVAPPPPFDTHMPYVHS